MREFAPAADWRATQGTAFARLRECSDTERSVPTSCTASGMTLFVVPPSILAMVSTTGSNALILRVTKLCSASTISHATGIGSTVKCGCDACPPLPTTLMLMTSVAAMKAPAFAVKMPVGTFGVMCIANAPSGFG